MAKLSEYEIQKAFIGEVSLYPLIRQYLFAIPNGGSRHLLEAVKLKASGVTAGVPDLFLSIPANGRYGLYLECKSKRGILSPEQKKKIFLFEAIGYTCKVFRDAREGVQMVKDYLNIERLIDYGRSGELCPTVKRYYLGDSDGL